VTLVSSRINGCALTNSTSSLTDSSRSEISKNWIASAAAATFSAFCGSLELLLKLRGCESQHSTVGVVEYCNLASAQQPLGDNQWSDRVLSVRQGQRICFLLNIMVLTQNHRHFGWCEHLLPWAQVEPRRCEWLEGITDQPQGTSALSPVGCLRVYESKRTYCQMLGRRNRRFHFIFETGHIGQISVLKVSVNMGGHRLWFLWWRWGFRSGAGWSTEKNRDFHWRLCEHISRRQALLWFPTHEPRISCYSGENGTCRNCIALL